MSRVFLLIFGLVLSYYLHIGVTTTPWEGDSLAQHLPIADLVESGRIWGGEKFESLFFYYPANAETILVGMRALAIPQNLFNVFAWVLLFLLCRKIGGTGFGVAVALLPSVLRLLSTQTVDIYVAVGWLAAWVLIQKKHVLAGLALGLLSGTKYSGLPYASVLWLFYSRQITWPLILGWLGGGGFWYVRNLAWLNNPIYPAGDPSFKLTSWQAWMTVVQQPIHFLTSVFSEFLAWPLGILAGVDVRVRKLLWLASANLGVYLILPSWPENTLSDLRYAYPVIIPVILAVYTIWPKIARVVTLISAGVALTQLDYHPKLFVAYILLVSVYVYKKTNSGLSG